MVWKAGLRLGRRALRQTAPECCFHDWKYEQDQIALSLKYTISPTHLSEICSDTPLLLLIASGAPSCLEESRVKLKNMKIT